MGFGSDIYFPLKGGNMDKGWFGIILAVIGAIVGLLGGFVWHSLGWTAAGIVFFVLGIFIISQKA
jgi:hypothetical protein